MPLKDQVQVIKARTVPTNKELLGSFKDIIKYYRDIWKRKSDILTPLSGMTSKQAI